MTARRSPTRKEFTPAEDAILRDAYARGAISGPELMALLPGRSETVCRQRAYRTGLSRRDRFDPGEARRVSRLSRRLSPEAVAVAVYGDPAKADRVRAIVAARRTGGDKWTPEIVARVVELNAAGMTDADIAAAMPTAFGCSQQVDGLRKTLGLASNGAAVKAAAMWERAERLDALAARYGLGGLGLDAKQLAIVIFLAGGPRRAADLVRLVGYNSLRKRRRLSRLKELGLVVTVRDSGQRPAVQYLLTASALDRITAAGGSHA